MNGFTVVVEIPALERLCEWLEGTCKAELVAAIEDEIVAKLKAAAQGGVPRPAFREAPAEEVTAEKDGKAEGKETAASVTADAASPSHEGEGPNAPPQGPAEAAKAVTLEAVQRAAARLRDEGKKDVLLGMFPEFGIKKLSDLKGDALQAFGKRLREMGAEI